MSTVTGTSGNDTLTGTTSDDFFAVQQGGDDALSGLDGNDLFAFRNAFNVNDTVDGGTGNDLIRLNGDAYSDSLTLGASQLTSVETIQFGAGHDYALTTVDANVPAAGVLEIDGICLTANDSLVFDGSAETDGSFKLIGGAGSNNLTGSANGDLFILRLDGAEDFVHGGGGNDRFDMSGSLNATDTIDGGAGTDTVMLQGIDVSDSLTLSATSFSSVERLVLGHGFDYNITENDGDVAAGATLLVEDQEQDEGGNNFFFDGSAETDGHFNIKPEQSNATLIGGAQHDRFDISEDDGDTVTGGGGKDMIITNGGFDTFIYNAASDSTSMHFDTITHVSLQSATFDVPWGTVGVVGQLNGGTLSKGNFDSNIASEMQNVLVSHDAIVWSPNSGDFAGQSFLIIDVNGTLGYQAGHDLVIDITGFTGIQT